MFLCPLRSLYTADHYSLTQPLPDVVSSQGHYLVAPPDTPVIASNLDPSELQSRLESLLRVQHLRCHLYGGENAEEWPISHTPLEIRERYFNEQKRVEALLEVPTPPENDSIAPSDCLIPR